MTPEEAFTDVLREAREGSNLQLAYESVGRSTRILAEELDVSQRTVQRWLKFESGASGEARNPATSGKAGDIRAMADAEREAREERALDNMRDMREFETDSVDVNYVEADGEDQGARNARTMVAPLNLRPVVDLYRQNAPPAEVGSAFARALGESYGLPEDIVISQVHGLSLH